MIGIAIAAVGIPDQTARRCYQSLADARIAVPYRVHVQTTCEGQFSRSAARNQAILALIPHCDQIVCLDVDCLVPPGLIELAAENIRDGRAVWTLVRKIPTFDGQYRWDEWRQIRPWPWGTGAFVGMTAADWLLVGGWDERIITWGSEDDILRNRRQELGIRTLKLTYWPLVHMAHPPYPGDRRSGANMRIGRTAPPGNWLTGRIRILRAANNLYLWVTAQCQRQCPRCSQAVLRQAAPGYQMPLEEVNELIQAVRGSGYGPFRTVCLVECDALLWSHLEEGTRRLAEAGLGPVRVFTNGLAVERAETAAPHVSEFRVLAYQWTTAAVQTLRARYGKKVYVVDSRTHWALPSGPYGGEMLPADCVGPGYLVYERHVYACCNSPSIPMALGTPICEVPRCRLQPGFIEALLPLRQRVDWYCRACIGNRKVQGWLQGVARAS
ncbi:MAG: hypothetical protein ACUVQK_12935 [Thermogutta sp.]